MDTMFCGDLIRQARKASGYTQEVLAKRAHISRTYLADVERNRYNPSMTTLQNIAQALNTSIHDLLPKVPIIHLSPEKQQLLYNILSNAASAKGVTISFAVVRAKVSPDFTNRLKIQKLSRIKYDDLIPVARYLEVEDDVLELVALDNNPDIPQLEHDLSGDISLLPPSIQSLVYLCLDDPQLADALLTVAQQIENGQAVQE